MWLDKYLVIFCWQTLFHDFAGTPRHIQTQDLQRVTAQTDTASALTSTRHPGERLAHQRAKQLSLLCVTSNKIYYRINRQPKNSTKRQTSSPSNLGCSWRATLQRNSDTGLQEEYKEKGGGKTVFSWIYCHLGALCHFWDSSQMTSAYPELSALRCFIMTTRRLSEHAHDIMSSL